MSLSVNGGTLAPMPRWEPDARARLQEAALTLYEERGFDHTSVEEIAERAGLTKRTFFRHFSDKREVLFGGGERAEGPFVAVVREAPLAAGALDAVSYGLMRLPPDSTRRVSRPPVAFGLCAPARSCGSAS